MTAKESQTESRVKKVTIGPEYTVDESNVRLSKRASEGVQWRNESDAELTIGFQGFPLKLVIAPRRSSGVLQATPGSTEGSYPYEISPAPARVPPNPPQVTVDP